MPSDVSEKVMTGIGIPHPGGLTIWEAESSYTEQSPRPGVPTGDSALELVATGETQEVPEVQIQCVQPGLSNEGRFAVSADGGSTWLGWDSPCMHTDFEHLAWPSVLLDEAANPHAVRLGDGAIAVVYERVVDDGGQWQHQVVVTVWDAATDTWSSPVVVDVLENLGTGSSPSAKSVEAFPTIALEPGTGALVVCHWSSVITSGTVANAYQVRTWISQDQGDSWRRLSAAALPDAIPFAEVAELRRLRAAYARGQLALFLSYRQDTSGAVVETWDDAWRQYASRDLGGTFRLIWEADTTLETEAARWPEVVVLSDGTLLVGAVVRGVSAGDVGVKLWRLSSASQSLPTGRTSDQLPHLSSPVFAPAQDQATAGPPTIHTLPKGGLAMVVMEDGEVYAFTRQQLAGDMEVMASARSQDGGESWDTVGYGSLFGVEVAGMFSWLDSGTYAVDFCAVASQGRVMLATSWEASTSVLSPKALSAVWLGGYSTVEHPSPYDGVDELRLGAWTYSGLPVERPVNQGVYGAAGAGAATLTQAGLRLDEDYLHSRVFSGTRVLLERNVAWVSDTGGEVGLAVRLSPATQPIREVRVVVNGTGYTVEDVSAATTLATVTGLDTAAGIGLTFALDSDTGLCRVTHRQLGGAARQSADGYLGTVANGGTGTGIGSIEWGHLSSTVAGHPVSVWSGWPDAEGLEAGQAGGVASQTVQTMIGRRYAERGVDLLGGLGHRALDGPALPGDIHTIQALADWRLWRALGAVNARHAWRSQVDGVAQALAWAMDPVLLGSADSDPGSDLCVLWLKTNIRSFTLSRYTGGAWVSLGSVDLAASAGTDSLPFARHGATLVPAGDVGDVHRYFGDLVGWTAILPGGVMRRVRASSEGSWVTAGGRGLVLELEGVDGSEPTSGDLDLVPDEVAVLVTLQGEKLAGWKLDIAAQSTVDGFYQLSGMLGPVKVTRCMDWAWGTTHQPHVESRRTVDRLHDARELAPTERVWEWGWDRGRITTWYTAADYLLASTMAGAVPVATKDVPQLLAGLWEQVGGGKAPVLALRSIPVTTSALTVLTRREAWLYGVTQGDLVLDSVIAESSTATEGGKEIIRVPRISVRELS